MNLIVISNAKTTAAEIDAVIGMFRDGLHHFHLRKPKASKKDLEAYLNQIPAEYHQRIILHSHHALAGKFQVGGVHLGRRHRKKSLKNWWRKRRLKMRLPNMRVTRSFHRLSRLLDNEAPYNYVFLSPVFEGITKKQHAAGYSERKLSRVLPRLKDDVVALGGVDATKVDQVISMGFDGLALWGALWEDEGNARKVFLEVKAKLAQSLAKRAAEQEAAQQEQDGATA